MIRYFQKQRSLSILIVLILILSLLTPAAFASGNPANIEVKIEKADKSLVDLNNPLQAGEKFSLVVLGSNISKLYGYSIDFTYDPMLMVPDQGQPIVSTGAQVFAGQLGNFEGPLLAKQNVYRNNTVTLVESLHETDEDNSTTVAGAAFTEQRELGRFNFTATASSGQYDVIIGDRLQRLLDGNVNLAIALGDDTPEIDGKVTQAIPYTTPTMISVPFGEMQPVVEITTPASPIEHGKPTVIGKLVQVAGVTQSDITGIDIFVANEQDFQQGNTGIKLNTNQIPVTDGEFSTTITMPDSLASGIYYILIDAYSGALSKGSATVIVEYQKEQDPPSEYVTIDPVGSKKQGESFTISGTTNLSEVTIKIVDSAGKVWIGPVTKQPSANGEYTHSLTLGEAIPVGIYTILVGNGDVEQKVTFEIVSNNDPNPPGNGDFGKVIIEGRNSGKNVQVTVSVKDLSAGFIGLQVEIPIPQGVQLSNPKFLYYPSSGLKNTDIKVSDIVNGVYTLVIGGERFIDTPLPTSMTLGELFFETSETNDITLDINSLVVNVKKSQPEDVNLSDIKLQVPKVDYIQIPNDYFVYDVNRDGKVNITDYSQILFYIGNIENTREVAPQILFDSNRKVLVDELADNQNFYNVNLAGQVNITDYSQVLFYIANLEDTRYVIPNFPGFEKKKN